MRTTVEKKAKRTEQVTMEDVVKKLVELANGYASYAEKSPTGDCLSIKSEDTSVWVSFVNNVWFVNLGDVKVTTNSHTIGFPYKYTINDLLKTYTIYTKYLDKLNADLSKRTKEEIEAKKSAEIEKLKSKLAELESGK